jgi:hypothetical protein
VGVQLSVERRTQNLGTRVHADGLLSAPHRSSIGLTSHMRRNPSTAFWDSFPRRSGPLSNRPHPRVRTGTVAILVVGLAGLLVRCGPPPEASVVLPLEAVALGAQAAATGARPWRVMEARCAYRGGSFLLPGWYAVFVVPDLDLLGVASVPARVCATACEAGARLCRAECADRLAPVGDGCVTVSCGGDRADPRTTARIWLR